MKSRHFTSLLCVLSSSLAMSAHAAWPDKPVVIVVPFSAGGNTDSIARITAEWLTGALKASVIVDNKPGANGALAAEYVARAKNDGYTLFMATAPQMAILPRLQAVKYDPQQSFAPISIVATNPFALAVATNTGYQKLGDLVEDAKAKPGLVSYASAGTGSVSHLTTALFAQRAGIRMNHVPYKGGAPAIADVVGGHVPLYFGNVAEVMPHAKGGKLKVLAVSGAQRAANLPDVPTIAEQGYAGFETSTWNAVAAPAGTPPEIVGALAKAIESACKDTQFKTKLRAIGVDPLCSTPQKFTQTLNEDIVKWTEAVKISGAKLE